MKEKDLNLSYVDVKDLLEVTGIQRISISGSEANFSCPSEEHLHGDINPSARMNLNTALWVCHSCGKRGNAISFLSWYKKIPQTEARRLLEERYGGELTAPIEDLTSEVKRIMNENDYENLLEDFPKFKLPSESWIDEFKIDWFAGTDREGHYGLHTEYMLDRGFREDILDKWQIGYDSYTDRITIPIRNEIGTLVGFKGRQYKDNPAYPRYLILGDSVGKPAHYGFDRYMKSAYVFGLNIIPEDRHFNKYDAPILVEGELNVIAMDQHGYYALGIAGSEFSDLQAQLIIRIYNKITIYFDNDEAGRKGTRRVVEMLSPHMNVNVIVDAPGDAAQLPTNEINKLIADAQPALTLMARGDL